MSRHTVIAVGVLLLGALPALGQDRDTPDLIYSQYDPGVAVWVSADEALTATGELHADRLRNLAHKWEFRQSRDALSDEGCYAEGMVLVDPLPHQVPVSTLEQLHDFSLGIVSGMVAGIEPGFFWESPGSLLRLEPTTVVSGTITASSDPLFVHYPNARFDVGSYSFCKSDPRLPHAPELGDTVLVFIRTGVWGNDKRLISPLPDDVFIETKDGELLTPAALDDDPVVAAAQALEDIVAALPTEEQQR